MPSRWRRIVRLGRGRKRKRCPRENENGRSNAPTRGDTVAQLEERSFDGEEKESGGGIDSELNANERGRRCKIDIVRSAKCGDAVDAQLLNQVGAVGETGDEGRAGDCHSSQRETIALCTNEQCSHREREQRNLPDARGESDVIALTEPQRVTDERERGQQQPP